MPEPDAPEPAAQKPEPDAEPTRAAAAEKPRPRRSRLRRVLQTIGVSALALLIVAAVSLGGAEYYTSQPDFCGSCHVMDPYYDSWSNDIHGARIGVRCIDCHYAPGERFTVMAKFKGLSQVASYFSGRYGHARPRAHVSDDSCLRSGCHGDQAFVPKLLPIGEARIESRLVDGRETEVKRLPTVHFSHAKHLEVDARLAETTAAADGVYAELRAALPAESLARIRDVAISVGPGPEREATLRGLASQLGLAPELAASAQQFMDLRHRETRLRQLAGLNCSACHSYDASGDAHIAVDYQVCYTCHFNSETFNRGTGACLNCHEPPTRAVFVHDLGPDRRDAGVMMDHQDIIKRGIDCESCHADVLRGAARVTARDCTRCHDQSKFLEGFETRTIETVAEYHAVHVARQRAHCQDCHRNIEHGLLDPAQSAGDSGFLQPVLDECRYCHPNHHSEQVSLLSGTGGEVIGRSTPSAMLGSRLNCRACHTDAGEDAKGDALVRASQQACVACHSADYADLFAQWKNEIDAYVRDAEAQLKRVDGRLETRRAAERTVPEGVVEIIERARANIRLVRVGNGMHNRHYALQLLDSAWKDLQNASGMLAGE